MEAEFRLLFCIDPIQSFDLITLIHLLWVNPGEGQRRLSAR